MSSSQQPKQEIIVSAMQQLTIRDIERTVAQFKYYLVTSLEALETVLEYVEHQSVAPEPGDKADALEALEAIKQTIGDLVG